MVVVIIFMVIIASIAAGFLFYTAYTCDDDGRTKFMLCVLGAGIVLLVIISALEISTKPKPEYRKIIVTEQAPVIDTTFTTTNGITDTTYTIKIKK